MKRTMMLIGAFIVVSAGLTWLWLSGLDARYAEWTQPLANRLNRALGLHGPGSMYRTRFINLVPFISLVLFTPKLSLRRRSVGLLVGLLVLMASHLVFNAAAVATGVRGSLPTLASLASDSMPFLLWFVIAREFAQEKLRHLRARTPLASTRASD